jgi:aminopeptidase N
MPTTQARPEIVVLLCDADIKRKRETNTWNHLDGRPFSKEEQALVLSATRVEFEEIREQFERYREYRRSMDEAPEALQRFLAPFMEQLTRKTLGNAVELMNEGERAEFDRLLRLASEPVRSFTPYTA